MDLFDVILVRAGENKVGVVREVRALTGLSLSDAEKLVNRSSTTLLQGVSNKEAVRAKGLLEAAGGTVRVIFTVTGQIVSEPSILDPQVKNKVQHFVAVIIGGYLALGAFLSIWGFGSILIGNREHAFRWGGFQSLGEGFDSLMFLVSAYFLYLTSKLIQWGITRIDLNLFRFRSRLPYFSPVISLVFLGLAAFAAGYSSWATSYSHFRNRVGVSVLSLAMAALAWMLVAWCPSSSCKKLSLGDGDYIRDKKSSHCFKCGEELHLGVLTKDSSCSECGRLLSQHSSFCSHCGTKR